MISAIFAETKACDEQSGSPWKEETNAPTAILEYVLPNVEDARDQKEDGKGDRCPFNGDVDPVGGSHDRKLGGLPKLERPDCVEVY